jgi:hypothetical protein
MATKDVYVLTSKRAPWRRAGLVFESRTKPITIDADALTEDQLKKLNGDPAITVVKTTVEDEPPAPSPTPVIEAAAAAVLKATEPVADAPPVSDAATDAPPPPPAADKSSKSTTKS